METKRALSVLHYNSLYYFKIRTDVLTYKQHFNEDHSGVYTVYVLLNVFKFFFYYLQCE